MLNFATGMIGFGATIVLLIYGKHILIPLLFGFLLWFLVKEIKQNLNKVTFIKKHIPSLLKTILAVGIIILFLFITGKILSNNIEELLTSYAKYEKNIDHIGEEFQQKTGISIRKLIQQYTGSVNYGNILNMLVGSITEMLSSTFMVILYALFMFMEENSFSNKLKIIFRNSNNSIRFVSILRKIEQSVAGYLGIKIILSSVVAGISFIIFWISGIDAPLFWAFLLFLSNFIPTVGTIAGMLIPGIFYLLQTGDLIAGGILTAAIGLLLGITANIIEPKLLGNKMNISALATILSLVFWGSIWGITGMVISVPMTVVLLIIFSHFESTKTIAILLSEKGELD